MPLTTPNISGSQVSESLQGSENEDFIVGLAGDDVIESRNGDDLVYGDFVDGNRLDGTEGLTSFAQYGASGFWEVTTEPSGHNVMSQTIETSAGASYSVSFELAANFGGGTISGAVEVLWNGVVVDSFDTNSAIFENHTISFDGTGGTGELTFRSIDSSGEQTPAINTDGPVFYIDAEMDIGGQTVTVATIAAGQAHIYQVLNGKLHVFDPESEIYTAAGAEATVVTNAIGYNQQDNLIYGIAVSDGFDSLGNTVSKTDLIMLDAVGNSYRIGESPYRSWTADFDADGNLWAFQSSMDRVTRIDVDNFDANGNPISVTFKFPKDLVTDKVWDVAFDAASQSFYGIVRPSYAGGPAKLFQADISAVAEGGAPVFSTSMITGTMVDGVLKDGVPAITFGAFMIDGDGNFYAGGNGGDHDMDSATSTSGGIYRVETNSGTGELYLVLVADAPKSYSNDGAIDPRTIDPFTQFDTAATVLIREPELIQIEQIDDTYDDTILAGGGADEVHGGFGEDTIIGASGGDTLSGDDGDDALYGGAGPDWTENGLISFYDENGIRYDQYGNLLPADDDILFGGAGDDVLDGSSGHDLLDGGLGNDILYGGSGFDTLYGGAGADTLFGGSHADTLHGGDGTDILNGGSGDDTLNGGAGADVLNGGSGNDILTGGTGDDVLVGGAGDDTLNGNEGDDSLIGGSGVDTLYGGSGDDDLRGGNSDDLLSGEGGADILRGGAGNDTLSGGDGADVLKGDAGDDILNGNDGNDRLLGGAGNDTLDGGDGRDRLYLGAGDDIASGGARSDTFIFNAGDLDGSTDRITDFTRNGSENDRLDFRQLNLLAAGESLADWIEAHVNYTDSLGVTIALGSGTLILADYHGVGDSFLFDVTDGILI